MDLNAPLPATDAPVSLGGDPQHRAGDDGRNAAIALKSSRNGARRTSCGGPAIGRFGSQSIVFSNTEFAGRWIMYLSSSASGAVHGIARNWLGVSLAKEVLPFGRCRHRPSRSHDRRSRHEPERLGHRPIAGPKRRSTQPSDEVGASEGGPRASQAASAPTSRLRAHDPAGHRTATDRSYPQASPGSASTLIDMDIARMEPR